MKDSVTAAKAPDSGRSKEKVMCYYFLQDISKS